MTRSLSILKYVKYLYDKIVIFVKALKFLIEEDIFKDQII